MAKTVAQVITLIRKRADIEGSIDRFPDTELLSYLNESFAELHDILEVSFEDYHLTKAADVVCSSATSYVLPYAVDGVAGSTLTAFRLPDDCNKVRMLRFLATSGVYVPIDRVPLREMHLYGGADAGWASNDLARGYLLTENAIQLVPEANPAGTYQLWYTRRFVEYLLTDVNVPDQQGWHQYGVVDAAIKCLKKDMADPGDLLQEKASLLSRIKTSIAPRDAAQPKRVIDVRGDDDGSWYGGRRRRGY